MKKVVLFNILVAFPLSAHPSGSAIGAYAKYYTKYLAGKAASGAVGVGAGELDVQHHLSGNAAGPNNNSAIATSLTNSTVPSGITYPLTGACYGLCALVTVEAAHDAKWVVFRKSLIDSIKKYSKPLNRAYLGTFLATAAIAGWDWRHSRAAETYEPHTAMTTPWYETWYKNILGSKKDWTPLIDVL